MARSDNYYDNLNQQQIEQAQTVPAQQDVRVEPTPEQLENPKIAEAKVVADQSLQKTKRSIWSRMPYETMNTIFDMPEESAWANMNIVQKQIHLNAEQSKLAWHIIKSAPRAIVSAPFKLAYTGLEVTTSIAESALGLKEKSLEPSINIPYLGEIRGFRGSYQEGIDLGFSPFFATVKATGEVAGDAAITVSLAEAVAAAFKPRLATLTKPKTGKDFRPNIVKPIEGTAKASDKSVMTGEAFESIKNKDISYFKLPKSTTSKYKGNPNNTFLKVSPSGPGTAEFSVVQIRKSLVDKTKDLFSKKFGKSKIIEGEFGPEIKLESGLVKYKSPEINKAQPIEIAKRSQSIAGQSGVTDSQQITRGLADVSVAEPAEVIKSLETKLHESYLVNQSQVEETLGEIWQELTLAEAGKRVLLRTEAGQHGEIGGVTAQKSTFPQWIPEDLRSKALIDKVTDSLQGIKSLTYPTGNQTKVRRLYDTILDEVDSRTGISTTQIRNNINRSYESVADVAKKSKPLTKPEVVDPFAKAPELPTLMAKPLKGFENELVTEKQTGQIINLKEDREINDQILHAITKVVTGKDNLYDLTQTEAFDVSETMRSFPEKSIVDPDWKIVSRAFTSYTHPARYWMEAAERELNLPIYSEVFIPMETGSRLLRVYTERWQDTVREAFGEYSDPVKYVEDRRLITSYIEGNKDVILKNKILSEPIKKDLAKIGDWLITAYKDLFSEVGISSKRFFEIYSPKIRKRGGIFNIYKSGDVPAEIKPFFEFEREGMLAPLEDDALALFDIYTKALGKKKFIQEPVERATQIIESSPQYIKEAVNSYVQEKLGFQDGLAEYLNRFGENLSVQTGGVIPKDISKQMINTLMTTSYAGALGLPRIMPIFRNSVQVLLTTYPELGPEFFAKAVKAFYSEGGLTEVRDKGFLVKMGVPYGGELVSESGRGAIGKSVDKYNRLNRATMAPYGGVDINNRGITYHGVKERFNEFWNKFTDGKITYDQFAEGINMDGFSPTLQSILGQKFQQNTKEAIDEALDLMIMDILDRTQFPYRKGSESRLHYGLKGKMGLQFAQWTWEYLFTIKSWVSRGQWSKLIRWMGMSSGIKRTVEDMFGVDVSKWVNAPEDMISFAFGGGSISGAAGPFSGFPLGPVGKMAASAVSGFNSAFTGMTEDLNKHAADIVRSMKIYGGVLTGVGTQKAKNFWHSMERYDAGVAVSPDPDKPFGIWSSTGKLIRWTDFTEQLKILFGFSTEEGSEMSSRIGLIKKESVERENKVNKAMNYLVDGNFDKFSDYINEHSLLIPDITAKLKSYNIPLDQRIFERMPLELQIKYFNSFYPLIDSNN